MNFLFPVPQNSPVTQDYAAHVLRAKVYGWNNYNGGIDFAIVSGTPLKAAQAGKVTAIRRDATGYGYHVRIDHGEGYLTVYGHMMDFAVQVGDQVTAGQVIGYSDNTGNSTGPHLHFELRKDGKAIDPAPLLVASLTEEPEPRPDLQPGDFVRVTGYGVRIRTAPELDDANIIGAAIYGTVGGVAAVSEEWVAMTVYVSRKWVERV